MNREQAQARLEMYAFGELLDAERRDIEAWLATDSELRAEFKEVLQLTELLGEGLRHEPEMKLTGVQRAQISWRGWRPLGRAKSVFALPLVTAMALFALVVVPNVAESPQKAVAPRGHLGTPTAAVPGGALDEEPYYENNGAYPAPQKGGLEWDELTERKTTDKAEIGTEPQEVPFDIPQTSKAVRPSAPEPAAAIKAPSGRSSAASSAGLTKSKSSPRPKSDRGGYWKTVRRTAPPRERVRNHDRFSSPKLHPTSTFSVDVDTASYSRMREAVNAGKLPSPHTRIEELVNYFSYDYPEPTGADPVSITVGATQAPWDPSTGLVRIGLRGRRATATDRGSNLVFLIDVSGSMDDAKKLPLLQRALSVLTHELSANDWVSIVVYAGRTAVLLDPTPGNQKQAILRTLNELTAQGSTDGGSGIEEAYRLAREHFIEGGTNRVFLATDGDFNLGISDPAELERTIGDQARSGVFLTVLGFGETGPGDERLERLADRGNGNYAYIDSEDEARKVLRHELDSTMNVVAKDVKLQVEFDPDKVDSYRLLGYDNRRLADRDFNNDKKDAGDIGSGQVVTALYEVIPVVGAGPGDLLTVNLRYKPRDSSRSRLLSQGVPNRFVAFNQAPDDLRFAAAVTGFGMLLRGYATTRDMSYGDIAHWAGSASRDHRNHSLRREFTNLVAKTERAWNEHQSHSEVEERIWVPPASNPARRGDCDPPYFVDADGIRKINPHCL